MGEYWNLRKAVATVEDNQPYWEYVISRTNDLMARYGNDYYLASMVLNLIHDLEARSRQMRTYGASIRCFNQMRARSGLPEVKEVM